MVMLSFMAVEDSKTESARMVEVRAQVLVLSRKCVPVAVCPRTAWTIFAARLLRPSDLVVMPNRNAVLLVALLHLGHLSVAAKAHIAGGRMVLRHAHPVTRGQPLSRSRVK